ncbi:MAG TPA: CHASE4 domain-containing protein, partial [Spirochaetia bacterium]|nr:CHASE4 domain-containing protein [Spirochaetia bacterium]
MLRRILLFIGITLVAMLLIITLATRTVFLEGFSKLERSFLEVNLVRVENAIFDEIVDLGTTTGDWATRDGGRRFPSLTGTKLIDLRLDVVLSRDTAGRIVFGTTIDSAEKVRHVVPRGLRDWLAAHAVPAGTAEGIIPLPEGPLMVAIRPIRGSQQGRILGTLLMGRFLDAEEVKRLSRSLRLSISVASLSSHSLPEVRTQPAGVLASVDASREDVVTGSGVLRDIFGSPALLLTVELPRDIHVEGVKTLRYFILWLVVIGVVFGAVVLLVVQRTILSRLQRLSGSVLAIGTGGEPGKRVSVKGRDQIAYLGAAINGMLEALEGSHERLRESERRNKAFLDAIPDLILRVARGGEILDARLPPHSDFIRASSGLRPGLLSEIQTRFPFVPETVFSSLTDAVTQALGTGLPVVQEFSLDSGKGMQHYQARIVA